MATYKYKRNNTDQCWHCENRIDSKLTIIFPNEFYCRLPICRYRGQRLKCFNPCLDFIESNETGCDNYKEYDAIREERRRINYDI